LNERRRLRAWARAPARSRRAIAQALGVTPGAVSQWLKRAREGGAQALAHRMPPGRMSRLSAEQKAELVRRLEQGAEAQGFLGDVWTTKRVASLIQQAFGVQYHPAHMSRLLRELGWSVQKPIRRATQRNDAAIRAWWSERWPALFAKPKASSVPLSG
jgi:transposase